MTLIITVLTKDTIYQSADFRLTDLDNGGVLTDSSTKLIVLQYANWHGFVAYTGIGHWKGQDTAAYLMEWLNGQKADTPQELEEHIRQAGTHWLGEIEAQRTRARHTFVLASFAEEGPSVGIISNFQNGLGERYSPLPSLTTTRATLATRPLFFVSGAEAAVTKDMRLQLRAALKVAADDPGRIRRLLTKLNAEAATKHAANGSISPTCSTASFRGDGRGAVDVQGHVDLLHITYGMPAPDIRTLFRDMGVELGTLVGATMASAKPPIPFPRCQPRVVTPLGCGGYSLVEVAHSELYAMRAMDISDSGCIIGDGTPEARPAERRLWTGLSSDVPHLSDFLAEGLAISTRGEVAATAHAENNAQRAVKWNAEGVVDLGVYKGSDSGAVGINSSGVVVGWVCIDTVSRGQANFRPVAFSDRLTVLEDFGYDWGQAVDINDSGLILVVAYKGWTAHALLWDPASDHVQLVGGQQGIFPSAIVEDGTILGTAPDKVGNSIAYIARPGKAWEQLGTPPGFYATSMNNGGEVVGALNREGYEVPWLRRTNGEIVWLPHYKDHSCRPTAINTSEQIVGSATADHGSHALVWMPPQAD